MFEIFFDVQRQALPHPKLFLGRMRVVQCPRPHATRDPDFDLTVGTGSDQFVALSVVGHCQGPSSMCFRVGVGRGLQVGAVQLKTAGPIQLIDGNDVDLALAQAAHERMVVARETLRTAEAWMMESGEWVGDKPAPADCSGLQRTIGDEVQQSSGAGSSPMRFAAISCNLVEPAP